MNDIFDKVIEKIEIYGIEINNVDTFNINLIIEDIKTEICTYCNIDNYPADNKQLDNILINIVAFEFLKSKNNYFTSIENEDIKGNIKSINIGDFSVSYNSDDNSISNEFIIDNLDKYRKMLERFRRLVW